MTSWEQASNNSEARFEILMAANVQITVSLVVTLCSLVDRYLGNLRIWQYSGFAAGLVETVFISVKIITACEVENMIIILTTTHIIIVFSIIIIILRNVYDTLVGKRERMRSRRRLALDAR
jgi:hypothetical protein